MQPEGLLTFIPLADFVDDVERTIHKRLVYRNERCNSFRRNIN